MKFNDITIGTRFEFEGIEYVKTSPVLATSKDGKQRLIRKSAILTPLNAATSHNDNRTGKAATLDRAKTLQAFDAFYQTCLRVAGNHPGIEAARQEFLDSLQ